jgi:hypothetical protein
MLTPETSLMLNISQQKIFNITWPILMPKATGIVIYLLQTKLSKILRNS